MCIGLGEPAHPLNRAFAGQGFEMTSELLRFHQPYSRQRVRVLLAIDAKKADLTHLKPGAPSLRADHDYALARIRRYGRRRAFYSTISHQEQIFEDAKMPRFYLDGAQFVLGDLTVPATPSAELAPAVPARKNLGWRTGVEAYTFHKFTFFGTIDKTADLGYWLRHGIDPVEAARILKDRILTFRMHDPHEAGEEGRDVPWGPGIGTSREFLQELHRQGVKPTMIGLEYSHDRMESMPRAARCV